ncbi:MULTISPECIES: hypothetical protein [unclassified Legionella]|uniref:hypothetical protein n=1 Tax=unclassified Legionella TaxID=2622702 RepID=UPI001054CBAA|nr:MULTISPECIES: hypothetical protein [unclassified Legionella]MDI9818442.1 hypothetical protein [Legionella sp. PL877]
METRRTEVIPHPQLLDMLFAFKGRVSGVFKDVLGLHEINHIAVSRINANHEILTFSSTPAMEFNLFSGNLWRFDKTYQPDWFERCTQAEWPSLYTQERYDELYYIKQIKHHYPIGYSLAAKTDNAFFIYSLASSRACLKTGELFITHYEDFYKIGQYCSNMLNSLFLTCDHSSSDLQPMEAAV